MYAKASRLGPHKIGLSLAMLATVLGLALPAQVWADQTESSTQTITGTANQIIGTATGTSGGIAVAGPAVAMNTPIVIQQNIQVDTTGNPNNDQVATNDATIDQLTGAASGNATGSDGGAATTGAAWATSTAIVLQINIQIITGFVPAEGVDQTASNVAGVDQDTLAGSGTSTADGTDSGATSGNASADNLAFVSQLNIQIYSGSYGGDDTQGGVEQDASNGADVGQSTAAGTGTATATDGGQASTGPAKADARTILNQFNWQYGR